MSVIHLNKKDWKEVEDTINNIRESFRRGTQAISNQKDSIPYGYIIIGIPLKKTKKLQLASDYRYHFVSNGYIAEAVGKHQGIVITKPIIGIPDGVRSSYPELRFTSENIYFYQFDLKTNFNPNMTMLIVYFKDGVLFVNEEKFEIGNTTKTYILLSLLFGQKEDEGVELTDYWYSRGNTDIPTDTELRKIYKQVHSILNELNAKINDQTSIDELFILEGNTVRIRTI